MAEQEQCKRGKYPSSNDKQINQSAQLQPANGQQVEGNHPPSLQPPSREENVPEQKQAPNIGQPTKDENGEETQVPFLTLPSSEGNKEENQAPKVEESAGRKKGEETPPTLSLEPPESEEKITVENKTSSCNNLLDEIDIDYVPVSPEFGEDLLSDLATCDVSSYINSFVSSSSECSTATVVVGSAPTYTTLQPATTAHVHTSTSILNTLPGGALFRDEVQGCGGLSCVPPQPSMPQLTGCEFQTNVLNTLALVLSNQQFIINELKQIKQNTVVPLAVCREGGNIPTLENVVGARVETACSVTLLTLDQLTKLKEKQESNSKTANSKAYLAVLIMNALTTKEQRTGRRVFGSKTKPSLDSNIVKQIREYFFMMYPCNGDDDKTAVWKSCIEKMDNRLKKYDKS